MKITCKAFSSRLPLVLLILFCLMMIITVFVQANSYGLTIDEPLLDAYGQSTLHWYTSFGRDTSFLSQYSPGLYRSEHGAFFDTLVAAMQQIFGHHWYTRAVVTGLVGVSGIIAIALCGYELGGWWGALLAAVGLWLYPRYYGAMWGSPKDIPFAAAMAWLLWSTLLLVKHWQQKHALWYCLLVGCLIGVASAVRVVGVVWFYLLVIIVVVWWLIHGSQTWHDRLMRPVLIKQVLAALCIGLTSLLFVVILWPYVFLDPFAHLYQSIMLMQHYPLYSGVLFNGVNYRSNTLPLSYVPGWLMIASPPTLIVSLLLGFIAAGILFFKKSILDAKVAVIFLALIIPLDFLVFLRPVLYSANRQFLFLAPDMVLIGVYGVMKTLQFFWQKRQKWLAGSLAVVLVASYLLVVKDMVNLHPYEYMYFNPIFGSFSRDVSMYDADYYDSSCGQETAQWLVQNYQYSTNKKNHIAVWGNFFTPGEDLITHYLPATFITDEHNPDFVITPTSRGTLAHYPGYHVVYVVRRDNAPLCVVNAKNHK